MRCQSCGKKFDYEKYYGICPKCGCFNQQQSRQERHEELHDRFGDESDHREKREYGRACAPERVYEQPEKRPLMGETAGKRKKGGVLLVLSALFLAVSVGMFWSINNTDFLSIFVTGEAVPEYGETLKDTAHEPGESFAFQNGMTLQVLECVTLADQEQLPSLEEGTKLIGVHVRGEGDGSYEDYNHLKNPFLETEDGYRKAVSSYDFEPYTQLFQIGEALNDYALIGEETCDGWYAFLVKEDVESVRLWIYAYDWSEWDGGNLLETHYVDLTVEEGGETDGE